MPKKKKKRKSKIQKRLERERDEFQTMFSASYVDAMTKDFCNIVEAMWDQMLDESNKTSEDLTLQQDICEFCALGWNILLLQQSVEDAQQHLAERITPKFLQNPIVPEIIDMVIILKDKYYPDHQVLIDKTKVSMKDGKRVIHVNFDMKEFQWEVEQLAADIPRMDDFIDRDALDKALEGVPEDQLEEVFKAAIKAQTDDYNNTPQDELGGLTPSEAFHRNRKR